MWCLARTGLRRWSQNRKVMNFGAGVYGWKLMGQKLLVFWLTYTAVPSTQEKGFELVGLDEIPPVEASEWTADGLKWTTILYSNCTVKGRE